MQHTDTGRDRGKEASARSEQPAQPAGQTGPARPAEPAAKARRQDAGHDRPGRSRQAFPGDARPPLASGPRQVPPRQPHRHGRTRLGPVRLRLYLRRCLRRSSQLWHGHHQPRARRARLQGRHHLPARLDRSRQHHRARRAAPGLSCQRRQHGFHGQPLFGDQAPPSHRCLHPRRRGGTPPQPRCHGLRQPHPPDVQRRPHHHRRHRGEPAPPGPLRLLAGQTQALGAARFGRRHPHLRHGRARDRRDRRRARRRAARRPDHLHQRHRLPHGLARRGLRLRPAAQLGRPFVRQAQLRTQL